VIQIAVLSQVLNGILPVFILVLMLLANKQDLMGAYTNSRGYKFVVWALTAVITG
jgi:Mn2+/Fe2+ NRAMP family transporter